MKNLFLFFFLLSLPMLSPAAAPTTAAPAETTTTEAAPKRPRKDFALKAQRATNFKFSPRRNFRRRGAGCRISLPQIGRPAAVNN